jgi:ribonuclease T2
MFIRTLTGLVALMLLTGDVAHAQRHEWPSQNFSNKRQKHVPGEFDYYSLVLSWSPTHCLKVQRGRDDAQCARDDGLRYGFVLHGLWPQYENGYPERCRTRWKPYVPEGVIDSMHEIMPSRGLVIHEYRTHGTCSGLMPKVYFDLSRRLYDRIQIPERYTNPHEVQFVSPQELTRELVRENPELSSDAIVITCGGPGKRLREVRVCLTKNGRARPCGANERRRSACRANRMYVPPVRSKRKVYGGRKWQAPKNDHPLPMPRVIQSPN